MPFTPYHFGPAAALKAALPRHFSFTVFCFAQVVIDTEVLYYLARGEHPVHRWLHTGLGATGVAVLSVLAGRPVCRFALQLWHAWRDAPLKRWFPADTRIPLGSAIAGAVVGAYSHIFLDCFLHGSVRPFAPWDDTNPLRGAVGFFPLHAACVLLGAAGVGVMAARSRQRRSDRT